MPQIVKTKYHDSEIAKSADFGHTASHPIELLNALIDGENQDVLSSFVFSGLEVQEAGPASMNVKIKAGLAFDRFASKFMHLNTDMTVPVTVSSPGQERIDTVEIRCREVSADSEVRAFKDPVNSTVQYMNVDTKMLVTIEARCLSGELGSGSAPLVEFGWVKLAEVRVQAGSGAIYAADIRGITAERDQVQNSAWTVEKTATFRQGSFNALKALLNTHTTANITGANAVHGIRQGHTNGFDADTVDGLHPASAATASTVMSRDSSGRSKVAAPSASDDVARKAEVDTHAGLTAAGTHGSASAATANTLMHRDANGRAKVASPVEGDDIARKDTVEAALSGAITSGGGTINGDLTVNGTQTVDVLKFTPRVASSAVTIASKDGVQSTVPVSYATALTWRSPIQGGINVYLEHTGASGYTCSARVLKNGSVVQTWSTNGSYTARTVDVAVIEGDIIQIQWHGAGNQGGLDYAANIRNCRIRSGSALSGIQKALSDSWLS